MFHRFTRPFNPATGTEEVRFKWQSDHGLRTKEKSQICSYLILTTVFFLGDRHLTRPLSYLKSLVSLAGMFQLCISYSKQGHVLLSHPNSRAFCLTSVFVASRDDNIHLVDAFFINVLYLSTAMSILIPT